MTEKQEKEWKDSCDSAQKAMGYIPAELLLLPVLLNLKDEGLVDMELSGDDFVVIKSREKNK